MNKRGNFWHWVFHFEASCGCDSVQDNFMGNILKDCRWGKGEAKEVFIHIASRLFQLCSSERLNIEVTLFFFVSDVLCIWEGVDLQSATMLKHDGRGIRHYFGMWNPWSCYAVYRGN